MKKFPTLIAAFVLMLPGLALAAGDVTASVSAGSLRLLGDDLANAVEIRPGGEPGRLLVLGLPGPDGIPTTVNGSSEVLLGGIRHDLRARTGRGADLVRVRDIEVPGDLSLRLGDGDDRLEATGLVVGGRLFVSGDRGADRVEIDAATVSGRTVLRTGPGADTLRLGEMTRGDFTGSAFGRDARIDLGSGDDEATVYAARFAGPGRIDLGGGDDRLAVLDSTFESGGRIDSGPGADAVERIRVTGLPARPETPPPPTPAEEEILPPVTRLRETVTDLAARLGRTLLRLF